MTLYVAPIVEGKTEVKCVERLLHRVWNQLIGGVDRLQAFRPYRGRRDSLLHSSGVELKSKVGEAYFDLARYLANDSTGRGLILVLLDAEDDCPAQLGPQLLQTAKSVRPDVDVACVLAKRMFECWIVGGAATLAGFNGLPTSLVVPSDPESKNGADWLDKQFRTVKQNRSYQKTLDASKLVEKMDLDACRASCDSFDKLCRELAMRLVPPPASQPDP